MIGWIVLAVWVVGWLGFTVTIARFIASDEVMRPDGELERALLIALAMVVALFWPLVIPGGWFYKKVWGGKS